MLLDNFVDQRQERKHQVTLRKQSTIYRQICNFLLRSGVRSFPSKIALNTCGSHLKVYFASREALSNIKSLVPQLRKFIATNVRLRYAPTIEILFDRKRQEEDYLEELLHV